MNDEDTAVDTAPESNEVGQESYTAEELVSDTETVYEGDEGDEGVEAQAFDPHDENWRQFIAEQYAEGDEGYLSRLNRLNSFDDFLSQHYNQHKAIVAGSHKNQAMPDSSWDAEQLSEWRENNGIPTDMLDYEITLDSPLEESDKPYIQAMLPTLHGANLNSEQVSEIVNAMKHAQSTVYQEIQDMDAQEHQQLEGILRENWAADYQTNRNVVNAVLEKLPEDFREELMSARFQDTSALMNHPAFHEMLVQAGRAMMPEVTHAPNSDNAYETMMDWYMENRGVQPGDPEYDQAKMLQHIEILQKANMIDENGNPIKKAA